MKISAYLATSVDGFIARKDGEIDWLVAADDPDGAEDYGHKLFYESVDCVVMGRNTMETVKDFSPWPYEGKRTIVLSRSLTKTPTNLVGRVELYSGPLTDLVSRLEGEGYKRLYIDGGKTIQSFLSEELVTDLTITKIPILLGEGLPLFGNVSRDIMLKHVGTETFPIGFVNSTYEVLPRTRQPAGSS